MTPEQVIGGWLLRPEVWQNEPMIYIKNEALRRLLHLKTPYARLADLFDGEKYRLQKYWKEEQGHRQKMTSLEKAIVEAVEYLVHFPGIYAAAGIGHADDGIAAFGLDAEGDAVFRLGMLDGVGQQVVDYFLHLFLVIPYFEAVCFLLEAEADLFGAGIFQEKQIVLV